MGDSYFWFLVDYVDGYSYENLLLTMWETPFYAKIKLDENLLTKASAFRHKHSNSTKNPGNCLEIFVQLALNMDSILYDSKHGFRVVDWFWLMMENMHLIQHDNPNFDEDVVKDILDKFVKRRFKMNGEGGPFPLDRPRENLRKVSWWYNLNFYINENFVYEFENLEEDDYE